MINRDDAIIGLENEIQLLTSEISKLEREVEYWKDQYDQEREYICMCNYE